MRCQCGYARVNWGTHFMQLQDIQRCSIACPLNITYSEHSLGRI